MSKRTPDEWSNAITTGFAETWFSSYPDDQELADYVNKMFPSTTSVTADQIRQDRKRFYLRSQRGEPIEEQEASPTKDVILNKASQLDTKEALAEIIDNIFDNFERNLPSSLEVEIAVYPQNDIAPGEIVISENSGGIENKRVIPMIQLGLSNRSSRGIGAWGEGFKMAAFALGEEVEVFSTFPGEEPIAIHFPKGWLDRNHYLWKKWKVNTYKIQKNAPAEGSTIIRINYVPQQVLDSFGLSEQQNREESEQICQKLTRYFGEIYAEKYHDLNSQGYEDISIGISLGNTHCKVDFADRVRLRMIENLAFFPWLRPIYLTTVWQAEIEEPGNEDGRIAKLSAEIYAGLTATFDDFQDYSEQKPGVEMWGNGRLFSLNGRVDDKSVGWGVGANPQATASSRRIVIVALFTAEDSRDIPWAAPVKNGYNRRSIFYAEIQDVFARIIRLYKDAARIVESRILPFSYAWTQMNDEEKVEVIFKESDATPEQKKEFACSHFGRKIINFRPDFVFNVVNDVNRLTSNYVHGYTGNDIKEVVKAAAETKQSYEQVIEFLQVVFPQRYKQSQIEKVARLACFPHLNS
jgi:hypothetical protein